MQVFIGDWLQQSVNISDESVQCCVTSPPYYGLRDYGVIGQIGLENTPEEFIDKLVACFRQVRRVLKKDGTLWLNMGDSYANDGKWGGHTGGKHVKELHGSPVGRNKRYSGLKPKDLMGIPWMVAFALRADGWWLRSDIIWHKTNPMPESVRDRPTKSHEHIFLLAKSQDYFYDGDAIKEDASDAMYREVAEGYQGHLGLKEYESHGVQNPSTVKERIIFNARKRADPIGGVKRKDAVNGERTSGNDGIYTGLIKVNKRDVWRVSTQPTSHEHYAAFPPNLIRPCILAGSRAGDVVLDPFAGSGTSGMVAMELGRSAVLCELNPDYVKVIHRRTLGTPGLAL